MFDVGTGLENPLLSVNEPAHALLRAATNARSEAPRALAAVTEAVAIAPQNLHVRLAAYKTYIYNHRWVDAREQALWCLDRAARMIGLARDWRAVTPHCRDFAAMEPGPGFWLQSLIALGYLDARLGDRDAALDKLEHAARLDPSDRFGGGRLAAVVRRGGVEEEM
jgi:tetratricopeptide (TPR) repeat protein